MLVNANSLHPFPLASGSVQCAVTSPPYWGLRDYGVDGQLGLEATPDCLGWATGAACGECYVCHMVQVFREVRRVLRDDGTCWLNLGDSFNSNPAKGGSGTPNGRNGRGEGYARQWRNGAGRADGIVDERGQRNRNGVTFNGLKAKDLIGIPWRVAFALQADGWWLRSDIIWAKSNPMPESVTDRPTKAHEYIFLLAKQERYYYDAEAVKEPGSGTEYDKTQRQAGRMDGTRYLAEGKGQMVAGKSFGIGSETRNRRTVWAIATAPYSGAHFATFPPALVEPCILAGTSERGCCPHCGAPWARVLETHRNGRDWNKNNRDGGDRMTVGQSASDAMPDEYAPPTTLGWSPTCACPPHEPRPCVVLDPFAGSGTTGAVARKHGRRFVGLDLNPTYLRNLALPRAEGRQTAASIAALPLFAQEAQ